jgi:DNA modification methylase
MQSEMKEFTVAELCADPANARLHSARNIEAIKASLKRFGQQKPIVVDDKGVVVAGNGTLEAARQLEWKTILCVVTNLQGADRTGFAIADNRTAELAEWDPDILAEQLKALEAQDIDLDSLGFSGEDLAKLLDGVTDGLVDPDEVPLPPDEAVTKPGDLIVLGNHRLLCGDSAKPEDVDRLLNGAHIQLANCDPPYGVRVEPRSGNAMAAGLSSFGGPTHHQQMDAALGKSTRATTEKLRAKDRPLVNDFVSDEEFARLLRAWFGNITRVLEPGRGFYIWGGYSNIWNYPNALKESELYFSQMVIWVKEHPVLTRKDFMGNHEWCFYGWKEGAAHKFYGPANITDVWSVKKVNPQSMVHLTEKPVELAVRAIQYSSLPGENVLDLFGGSGSSLIACEQTGRKAFLMEIDPLYADVIVSRWEKFTGRKAQRLAAPATAGVGEQDHE